MQFPWHLEFLAVLSLFPRPLMSQMEDQSAQEKIYSSLLKFSFCLQIYQVCQWAVEKKRNNMKLVARHFLIISLPNDYINHVTGH